MFNPIDLFKKEFKEIAITQLTEIIKKAIPEIEKQWNGFQLLEGETKPVMMMAINNGTCMASLITMKQTEHGLVFSRELISISINQLEGMIKSNDFSQLENLNLLGNAKEKTITPQGEIYKQK